jgi:diketogulonate reductase-like aldo/keto reductase
MLGSVAPCWYSLHCKFLSGTTVKRQLIAGASNFSLEQLIELLNWAVVPPAVVQRHSDLFMQDRAVQRFCLSQGIRYTAYSTLGTQYLWKHHSVNPVLNNEAVKNIAHKHGLSPAQVCLCDVGSKSGC